MRFAALRAPWYKGYLAGGSLLMAGDNAEHAITYFVMWQTFHSPLLAGFAVISHWLPHLLFSIPFGGLADRFDCRRIIQVSCAAFGLASLIWGFLFLTGTLQPWHCVVLLLLHGFASALWHPADGVMVYDIVGPRDLTSAVRLMSTGLSLGQLAGPAVGAVMLFTVGPAIGMFLNAALYLPFAIYLLVMPFNGHQRRANAGPRLRIREVFGVLRELPLYPSILVVLLLQGAVGVFIGTAIMPLLPEFGELLGLDASGFGYGLLLIATSAGAIVGGLGLEAIGRIRASTRLAIVSTLVFALCTLVFAYSRSFVLTLIVLAISGVATIVSGSTSQTVVQLQAPDDRRGRFLGAYGMTSLGLRLGSGVILGLLGSVVGIPAAIAIDATALGLVAITLFVIVVLWLRRRRDIDPDATVVLAETGPQPVSE